MLRRIDKQLFDEAFISCLGKPGSFLSTETLWDALVERGLAEKPQQVEGTYVVRWWRDCPRTLASVGSSGNWYVELEKAKWTVSPANGFPKEPFEIIKKVDL